MKFEVTQTLVHTIIVEAESEDEAMTKAKDIPNWDKVAEDYEITEEWDE